LERRREEVKDRFGLLLVLLVGAFVALGFGGSTAARVIAGVLQVAALAVAFLATEVRKRHLWLAVAAMAGVLAVVLSGFASDIPQGVGSLASILVVISILVAVLERVLRHPRVSFITMTTVGFGDYTAETDVARRVVVIEAVLGQVFIPTTLARLVLLYKSPQREGDTQ
jgi:Ion channel